MRIRPDLSVCTPDGGNGSGHRAADFRRPLEGPEQAVPRAHRNCQAKHSSHDRMARARPPRPAGPGSLVRPGIRLKVTHGNRPRRASRLTHPYVYCKHWATVGKTRCKRLHDPRSSPPSTFWSAGFVSRVREPGPWPESAPIRQAIPWPAASW